MENPRIHQLLDFLKENPEDPFNHYALALEYLKTNEEEAARYFEVLLKDFPQYVPTYYHVGKFYQSKGKKTEAETVYRKGLEVSQNAGNRHAFRELQSALNELLFDDDE